MGISSVNSQYDNFLSYENFTLAYKRLKTSPRSVFKEFYYDDFRYFETSFNENIESLILEIRERIYSPVSCEKYFMPKKKNLARPITMLTLIDQIVYQAIANVVADVLFQKMSRYFNINVFGNIFVHTEAINNIFFFEKWKTQWKRFNDNKRKAFDNGYEYSAEFDIASFYDTIDHRILCSMLKKYGIDDSILDLLCECLSVWTTTVSSHKYQRSCGIPQGPISSAFFAEVFLFFLDNEMRKYKSICYFRYADDIFIMSKTEEECRKMVVMLDLLARDISLVPQPEKIGVSRIFDIDRHLNSVTARFSQINNEYFRNDSNLSSKTHNKLKRQFLQCFAQEGDVNKTIVKFSLFKLNKDDEVKETIIKHMGSLELFYEEVIYYFNRHFPHDNDFKMYILKYLLGDTVLFQYNKALLFKKYEHLSYEDAILRANLKDAPRFWIVKYQLINWLERCGKSELAVELSKEDNYYIRRRINEIKFNQIEDLTAKRAFVETLISDVNPMVSLQGIYLWREHLGFDNLEVEANNTYSRQILQGISQDYFVFQMTALYGLTVPNPLLILLQQDMSQYEELKRNLFDFVNYKEIDANRSLMTLDLLHNIIFNVIAKNLNYATTGEFGSLIAQMNNDFPLSYVAFTKIHQARNQKTDAHYKDKAGRLRSRIKQDEYIKLLEDADLAEAYDEIFFHFSQLERLMSC